MKGIQRTLCISILHCMTAYTHQIVNLKKVYFTIYNSLNKPDHKKIYKNEQKQLKNSTSKEPLEVLMNQQTGYKTHLQ